VFDLPTVRRQLTVLGIIYAVDIAALLIFGVGLGWI
jgi:hypothetical protein